MGYTQFTVEKLEEIISNYQPQNILDFGAQNMYNQPILPAPYAKEWYESMGIKYISIDINNEHGAIPVDLSKPLTDQKETSSELLTKQFDMVVDAGTVEHVGVNGSHNVEAFYNAWKTKYDLCKIDGIIYSENPKSGSWPGHGFNYHTEKFYYELLALLKTEALYIGEHAACGNFTDGWNIYCAFIKPEREFITLDEFKNLSYKLN